MRKTTVNLTNDQINVLGQITENTGRDRSTVIRDIINKVVSSGEYDDSGRVHSRGRSIRRLTESARFIESPSDPIAFSYAGALHYLEQDKMINLATQLYSQNPLAHRVIEIVADFCVGDSITWETEEEEANELLFNFWNHPRNNFQATQHRRVSELLLYGEQCYPIFVNPITGLVQLGNIHPSFIKQTILDPDDFNLVIGVEVYNTYTETTTYRTVYNDDPEDFLNNRALAMRREMDGDCFYFPINFLSLPMTANGYEEKSYQNRGRSELLPVMDRLGMLDDLNYLNLDRIQILLSIIYDITITQGTPKDIEKILDDFGIPSGPAVRAHDENMKIDLKTPKLGASDTAKLFKMITDEVLGCIGIPSHWFGEMGNANRAGAMSMELPTLRKLKSRQRVVSDMFKEILDYQVKQYQLMGSMNKDVEVLLNVPAITRKDLVIVGDALNKTVGNIEKAVENRWITNRQAGEIFREIAEGYGIELFEPDNVDEIDNIIDDNLITAQEEVPEEDSDAAGIGSNKSGEKPYHDYVGLDNPEETRDEKEERDMSNMLSSNLQR